jgi:hypothetical protein
MSRPQHSKWESGLGLIEVMISVAVVAGLALFSGYYAKMLMITTQPTVENRFSCTTQASTMLSKIRGQVGTLYSPNTFYPQTIGGFNPPTGAAALFQYPTLVPDLWTGIPPIMVNTAVPAVGNAMLLSGPMRALNMLYMGTYAGPVDYCTTPNSSPLIDGVTTGSYPSLSTDSRAILAATPNVTNLTTKMQIQLYDLATGAIQPCSVKAWIHPQGLYLDSQNLNGFATTAAPGGLIPPAPYFTKPAATYPYTDQYGIFLQVQTSYSEYNPQTQNTLTQTCTASQKLSYDRDFAAPPAPLINVTVQPGGDPGIGGDANSHAYTLTLTENSSEPGLVMVCRDRSTRLPYGIYGCYYSGPTTGGPGLQASWSTVAPVNQQITSNSTTEDQSTAGTLISPIPATPPWVPCEQVTLCGKAWDSTPSIISTGSSLSMTANYSHLPSDCEVRIEAAAMDAAGNLNSGPLPYYTPAQSVTTTSLGSESTIPRPTCGPYACTGVGINNYWQTQPCCVVPNFQYVGCAPGMIGAPGPIILNSSTAQ